MGYEPALQGKGHLMCSVACPEWSVRGLESQIITQVATELLFYFYEIITAKGAREWSKVVEEIS